MVEEFRSWKLVQLQYKVKKKRALDEIATTKPYSY